MDKESNLSRSRILIVSYLFPPAGGIAVQRSLCLARYLADAGHEVHILKAKTTGPVCDPGLARRVPPSVCVHEAFTPEIPFALRHKLWARLSGSRPNGSSRPATQPPTPNRFSIKRLIVRGIKRLLCPEPEILWLPFALRKARKVIRRNSIDYVLVTVPPFSLLVLGTTLKRVFPSITLVSDFRDEWLSFYLKDFEFQNSEYTRRRAESIERDVVEASDLVVAVNASSCSVIRNRYPDEPDEKFTFVPNGYDPDAFADFTPRAHNLPRMIVTHAGTVYKTATPVFYLEALEGVAPDIRASIETRFVGRISDGEKATLEGRSSAIRVVGFVPQAEALKFMEETDYLLMTMTNAISVPGKLYEYMAAGKPILAITPAGSEVDMVLRETCCGISASPDDPAAIKAMLERAFDAWRKREPLIHPRLDLVQKYDRRRLVEEYGHIMQSARSGGIRIR
jgi:glycosyltransferase involved in cell wall biosynthesis